MSMAAQACDAFGNLRRGGGDGFQATVRGSPGAVRVEDRGDGTYAVASTLPAEGEYQVAVTGPDGRHVRGSPMALTVFRCSPAGCLQYAQVYPVCLPTSGYAKWWFMRANCSL